MKNNISIGMYKNMSNEDYHGHKESISRSAIMEFEKSPYNYWANYLNPARPRKDGTPQMAFGTLVHNYILEPLEYSKNYAVEPKKVLLKDVGREAYDSFKKECDDLEASGKILITRNEYENLEGIRERLHSNSAAVKLIEGARIENSFFWQDKESGLLLKSRPDILHENMIIDLKTTSDASPKAFQFDMIKYGYHIQFAMMRDAVLAIEGRRIENFINIVIETKYPYNVAIYMIDELAIDCGRDKYQKTLINMKYALEKDEFPSYGIQGISFPSWALNQEQL